MAVASAAIYASPRLFPAAARVVANIRFGKLDTLSDVQRRQVLEEAAGISKYKERRRETETRIRHTRENLDRLGDLREEIGKQLQHLARQARQAEQYTQIQGERRVRDAEWKALEFRHLDSRLQGLRETLAREDSARAEGLIRDLGMYGMNK